MQLSLLLFPAGVIFTLVTLLFLVSIILKRNDIADIAWGPGIALASWSTWYAAGMPLDAPTLLILGLISLWATRLGVRIFAKNLGKPEDPRYRAWRDAWGVWFYPRSYVQVFLLQGALMLVLSAVVLAIVLAESPTTSLLSLLAGAGVWLVGFFFEVVGDYQLDRFLAQPQHKGKLMRYGLWRYTRHPNYFGEICMWWGLFIIAAPHSVWLLAIASPLTITVLICFVSGIPMLEKQMASHPEWPQYKSRTSVLIPWWPKSAREV